MGVPGPVRGTGGDERHSQAAAHHRQLAVDRPGDVAGVGGEAGRPTAGHDLVVVVRGDTAGQPDPAQLGGGGQVPGLVGRRSPGRRHGQHERLPAQGDALAAGRGGQLPSEGDVDLAPSQRLDGDVRVDLSDPDVDPRVRQLEQLQHPRERVTERRRHRADPELPRLTVHGLAHRGVGGRRGGDQRPAGVEQDRPCAGERHLTGGAVQERGAEAVLEGLDRLAQRRLGHVQPLGRPAEVQLLGDRDEVPRLPDVHH
jgi:hypothetical protein